MTTSQAPSQAALDVFVDADGARDLTDDDLVRIMQDAPVWAREVAQDEMLRRIQARQIVAMAYYEDGDAQLGMGPLSAIVDHLVSELHRCTDWVVTKGPWRDVPDRNRYARHRDLDDATMVVTLAYAHEDRPRDVAPGRLVDHPDMVQRVIDLLGISGIVIGLEQVVANETYEFPNGLELHKSTLLIDALQSSSFVSV